MCVKPLDQTQLIIEYYKISKDWSYQSIWFQIYNICFKDSLHSTLYRIKSSSSSAQQRNDGKIGNTIVTKIAVEIVVKIKLCFSF